jgi:pSer/pThr/pTyr-binding forkhead associated (FHA) protein
MMPRLTLQFEGLVLKEYAIGSAVTIGRLPDNTVVIDNPAVSGHHARVIRDGDQVVLEDLESTNGTFVNDKHVTRHILKDGDVVLVGKHRLAFDSAAAPESEQAPSAPAMKNLGDTVYLDTKKHRELLATLRDARVEAEKATATRTGTKGTSGSGKIGVLRVLSGRADHAEYDLDGHTSLIGRSDTALIRLRGWFKPKIAVAIARSGDAYVATLLGGKTLVNSAPLSGRQDLKDGDVLQVSGLTLEFRLKERAGGKSHAA